MRKSSEWSKWYKTPNAPQSSADGDSNQDGGHTEERYMCTCTASVLDQSQLRLPIVKTSMRYCSANGDDCSGGRNPKNSCSSVFCHTTGHWLSNCAILPILGPSRQVTITFLLKQIINHTGVLQRNNVFLVLRLINKCGYKISYAF